MSAMRQKDNLYYDVILIITSLRAKVHVKVLDNVDVDNLAQGIT